jgi:hypothetical protein
MPSSSTGEIVPVATSATSSRIARSVVCVIAIFLLSGEKAPEKAPSDGSAS